MISWPVKRRLAEHQLGQGGAIHTTALLLEDLQDDRVRQCLDRKILLESLVPAEGLVDAADILPDALLVVDVERRGTSSMICCAIASVRNGFFSIITSLSFCAARHIPACDLSYAAQCRSSTSYSFRFSRVGVKVGIMAASWRTTPSSLWAAAASSACSCS